MLTRNPTFYYSAGFVGLSCLVWLVISVTNGAGDDVSSGQPQTPEDHLATTLTIGDEKSSTPGNLQHSNTALTPSKKAASACSAGCETTLSLLDKDLELDDEDFQTLRAHSQEIATYLQGNESKRRYYTQLAMTTTDGDKRAYITEVFKHLPEQQRVTVAENFIGSDAWRVRADGVALISDHGASNLNEASSLMNIFYSEESAYVKNKILGNLQNSAALRGDVNVLQQLDSALYTEPDASVRIAALKAKMQLNREPYHILPDALQALRSDEPDFQLAGLIAIEEVLKREKEYSENGTYIDKNTIENELEIIRNLAVYGQDKKRVENLMREADAAYLRYFQSSE